MMKNSTPNFQHTACLNDVPKKSSPSGLTLSSWKGRLFILYLTVIKLSFILMR